MRRRRLAIKREVRRELWHARATVVLIGAEPVFDVADEILDYADSVIAEDRTFDNDRYRELIQQLQREGRADRIGVTTFQSYEDEAGGPAARVVQSFKWETISPQPSPIVNARSYQGKIARCGRMHNGIPMYLLADPGASTDGSTAFARGTMNLSTTGCAVINGR
jgi:hypothetical protein